MLETIFSVLTDFRFEIGNALLGTKTLQDAVGGLQQQIDDTHLSFVRLSTSFVAGQTGVYGFLGAMGSALIASDKFRQAQLSIANVLSANKDHLSGPIDTFNEKLEVSKNILEEIGKQAGQFSLSGKDLFSTFKVLYPMLVPKGLAGDNGINAINMSRTLLKSAPNLGIDPGEVQGQLLRAIEGHASMGDTLFRRLVAETSAFDSLKGSNVAGSGSGRSNGIKNGNLAAAFNVLAKTDPTKAVNMLTEALNKFAKDTDILAGRVNSFTGQLQRLKSLLMGDEFLTNIFLPIGEEIGKYVVDGMKKLNDVLNVEGREIIKNISTIVKGFRTNNEDMLANVIMMKDFKRNVDRTKGSYGTIGLGIAGYEILKFFNILPSIRTFIPKMSTVTSFFSAFFTRLFTFIGRIPGMFTAALPVLSFIFNFVARFGLIVAALFTLFQFISKAAAIAHVRDAEALPAIIALFTQHLAKFQRVMAVAFGPLINWFNELAGSASIIFRSSYMIEYMVQAFNRITDVFAMVIAMTAGIGAFFGQLTANLMQGMSFKESLANAMDEGNLEMVKRWQEMQGNLKAPDGAVVSNEINIGAVNITNQFKNDIEPDRIAFSLKEQLLKAAVNPTQASGKAFGFGSRVGNK